VAAVIERDGRFLLVEERTAGGRVLNQPAGHLEDGEELTTAVCREVLEETGWPFEPAGLVGVYRWPMPSGGGTYLRFCFHGGCTDHLPREPLDPDILGTCWLDRAEMLQSGRLRSPLVLACIDDFRAGRSYPLELLRDL
jgi:8-oxo-dGTP pyrophosphatase MutT (NUDIX family)